MCNSLHYGMAPGLICSSIHPTVEISTVHVCKNEELHNVYMHINYETVYTLGAIFFLPVVMCVQVMGLDKKMHFTNSLHILSHNKKLTGVILLQFYLFIACRPVLPATQCPFVRVASLWTREEPLVDALCLQEI